MTKAQKVAAAVSTLKVGDLVRRNHKGLTDAQAILKVTETGVVGKDNNGRERPAFKAIHPAFADDGSRPYTYLIEEII